MLAWMVSVLVLVGVSTSARAQTYGTTTSRPAASASPTYAAPPVPAQPAPAPPQQAAPAPTSAAKPDSGLPDLFYVQPFVGFGYVHLKALDSSNFDIQSEDPSVDDVVVTSKGSGLRYGVAAGLNIIFIHVGGRVGFTQTDAFTLGTAQFEVALVPRLGPIEPSVRLGLGYAWQGGANYGDYKATDVYGLSVGAGLGLDARLGAVVGIGVGLDADLLNMSRSTKLSDATTIRAQEGSAVGIQVALTGHLTLHI